MKLQAIKLSMKSFQESLSRSKKNKKSMVLRHLTPTLNTIRHFRSSKSRTLRFKIYKEKISKFKISASINKTYMKLFVATEISTQRTSSNQRNRLVN